MDTLELQHWSIIALLVLQVVIIALAAAWSIGKVSVHLERQYSVLRDISGFMLLISSLEKQRAEATHTEVITTRIETPSASVTVSAPDVSQEIPR